MPDKRVPVTSEEKNGWAPGPLWMLQTGEKPLAPAVNQTIILQTFSL